MKIIVLRPPRFLAPIFRRFAGIKKKEKNK